MLLLPLQSWSQELIPINTWRTHFSYLDGVTLTANENRVYFASTNGFYSFRFEDESYQLIGTANDIQPTGITALQFIENEGLLIGYENGLVIRVNESGTQRFDAFRRTSGNFSKKINDFFLWDGRLLVLGDFGYIWVEITNNIIRESYYQIGPLASRVAVKSVRLFEGNLYFATNLGLLRATAITTNNFQNFNNYSPALSLNNVPMSGLAALNNQLIAATREGKIVTSGGVELILDSVFHLSEGGNQIFVSTENEIILLDEVLTLQQSIPTFTKANKAVFAKNNWWFSSPDKGLKKLENTEIRPFVPNSPAPGTLSDLVQGGNELMLLQRHGMDRNANLFKNGQWQVFPREESSTNPNHLIKAQKKGHWEGINTQGQLVGYDQDFVVSSFYDMSSPGSTLAPSDNLDYPNLSALAVDRTGTTWITQKGSSQLLHKVGDTDKQAFSMGNFRDPESLYINSLSDKWMTLSSSQGGGVLIFNEEVNFFRRMSTANQDGGLPSNEINEVVEDLSGRMWIATSRGVCFLNDPFLALSEENLSVSFPTIDFIVQLRNESISTIAVDGGNRIWMGTNEGIAIWDERRQSLERWTTENSPLPSNRIEKIQIVSETGEVFVYTNRGLVSFRSPALSREVPITKTKIYPNPVYNIHETVSIEGLPNNASFKITDQAGRLVFEGISLGTRASWNLFSIDNRRAGTGVYLVFALGENGRETFGGRFVILDR